MLKIKRALISVSDKTGLESLVGVLRQWDVEIVSTGGTAKFIESLGGKVRLVSDLTASPEMLDGRVKSLHPKIHGALLAQRDNNEHMRQVQEYGIALIDMVVVNLYPFEQAVLDPRVTLEEAVENIDIGGPSMLRSAAKNFRAVLVLCDPRDYALAIAEMRANQGMVSEQTCFNFAREVFRRTAEYDQAIARYFGAPAAQKTAAEDFPQQLALNFTKVQDLRYGENPHQKAVFYRDDSGICGVADARQLHGKELSFNNIMDLDAALNISRDFTAPAAAIIKHTNPCGVAEAGDIAAAFKDALACDPLSAFGGIVGLNRQVDIEAAQALLSADFIECVIAPGFSPEALEMLRKKKNIRIMDYSGFKEKATKKNWDYKRVNAGFLVQDRDTQMLDPRELKNVTSLVPSAQQLRSLLFAWTVAKHVRSNAIVLAAGTATVGIGAGQMSRVDSVTISTLKAQSRSRGAVLASDAFFPKADSVEQAAAAGIKAIIQPGGSIRDAEVIAAAEKAGMAMVFTGRRHFKH